MKHTFPLVASVVMVLMAAMPVEAQDNYYDITKYYLENADFSASYDYDRSVTGNVTPPVTSDVTGWSHEITANNKKLVVAVFQYGTAATIDDVPLPSVGPNGSADGNFLTLNACMGAEIRYYQEVTLPAGHYKFLVTYKNCNEASELGTSTSGWFVSNSVQALSQLTSFKAGEWLTDTISFTLDAPAKGKLRVAFKSPIQLYVKNCAVLAIDRVQLLRDIPYGDLDTWGDSPVVTTDKRFARGATMAFGRMTATISEGKIVERGFCWAEHPEPTLDDNSTTESLSNGAYWLKNLKPATKYYMRAYAKTEGRKMSYGDVIKFYTIPKGQITFSMRTSGDDASNRIKAAAQTAVDWWNALTEMKGFNTSIGYNSGTPTAECSYGGWMSVGSNQSYQRPGTIMHEMLHGVGVIPWADTEWARNNLRSGNGTGQWLGDRVTEVLRFWDNSTTEVLNGDTQHMWPYGINGASEDNGSDVLYIGNGLVCQALGEDGLQHTSSLFAEPYYAFDQEDDVKYYLKNEDPNRGLYSSYLVVTPTGALQWRAMAAADAQQNDSTAWYITFTPSNQYYQFRNAATGQYLTFSGGFKTVNRSSITANDNFHLMKGRVNVGEGDNAKRGYWMIHPTNNWSPNAMQANANGAVGSATFNIANAAKPQRWLILTAEETAQMEQASLVSIRKEVSDLLKDAKALANVPHVEMTSGADQDFATAIADIEQRLTSNQLTELLSLTDEANEVTSQFLDHVIAIDKPFDLTFRLKNPGMDSSDGWSEAPTLAYSCAEYYQKTFNINQSISKLPAGNYEVRMQGFQRPGTSETAYNNYVSGSDKVNAEFYFGTASLKIAHIASDAQTADYGGASVGGKHFPNTMQTARNYFDKGLYENVLTANVSLDGSSVKLGLRSTSMPDSYWCIFDNFRLYYYGKVVGNDFDRDGKVTVADVAKLGELISKGVTNGLVDTNGDGEASIADLIFLIKSLITEE